jgi:serine/threonine-protein kinase
MGIVLYALTTGKHPFRKESEGATLFAITAPEPVIEPRKFMPEYPEALQEVVLKALEKDRQRRYQSASELLRALDKALPVGARGSEEEVGAFVQGLFAEQRRRSQQTLADALERADKHQLSKSGTKFTEATLSGQSGVSGMSTVGVAASLVPPKPSMADIDAALAQGSKRYVKVAIVAGLGVVGALAALLFTMSGKQPEPTPEAAKVAVSAATPVAAPPPPTPAAPAMDLDALPVEATPATTAQPLAPGSDPSRKPSAAPRTKSDAAPAAAATAAKTAPAATTAPPKAWKHDPGF